MIKFRARWKDTKKTIPDFMEEYGISALNSDVFIVDEFTGLNDSSGVEIYEGDKVKIKYALNGSDAIGIIKLIDGCWNVSFREFEKRPFCPSSQVYRNQDYLKMFLANGNKINVIGNIYTASQDGEQIWAFQLTETA
jgi:hypothetical protein